MSFNAKYIQRGEAIDYVPAEGLAAGDIVFIGAIAGVAKHDILAGNLGAVAVGGIYDVVKGSGVITAGTPVYWDEGGKVAGTAESGKKIGTAIADAETANPYVRILLNV